MVPKVFTSIEGSALCAHIIHCTRTYIIHVHTHAYHLNHELGPSVIYPIVGTAQSVILVCLLNIEGSHIIPSLLVVSLVRSITEWELRRKRHQVRHCTCTKRQSSIIHLHNIHDCTCMYMFVYLFAVA